MTNIIQQWQWIKDHPDEFVAGVAGVVLVVIVAWLIIRR